VPEQLRLEQRLRQRPAVHLDERAGLARTGGVQRSRQQRLAGAGLAGDQHGRARVGDRAHRLEDRLHARIAADDVVEAQAIVERGLQLLVLAQQRRLGERAIDGDQHLVAGERLAEEVGGAVAHRLHGVLDRTERRQQHDGGVRVDLLHFLQQLHAAAARQAEVAQDEVDVAVADRGHRRREVGGGIELVAARREQRAQFVPRAGVGIGDEDLGHGSRARATRRRIGATRRHRPTVAGG